MSEPASTGNTSSQASLSKLTTEFLTARFRSKLNPDQRDEVTMKYVFEGGWAEQLQSWECRLEGNARVARPTCFIGIKSVDPFSRDEKVKVSWILTDQGMLDESVRMRCRLQGEDRNYDIISDLSQCLVATDPEDLETEETKKASHNIADGVLEMSDRLLVKHVALAVARSSLSFPRRRGLRFLRRTAHASA